MKIINSIILIFGITLSMFAQEINKFDSEGKRHGLWRKNYDGTNILRYEGQFDHGKEKGIFNFYENDNGKAILAITKEFSEYSNDAYVKFFENGKKLISEGMMRGKNYIGVWKYYQKDSKALLTVENYNDSGLLNGDRITYYKNGEIAEEKKYVEGKLIGESKWYSEQGVVLKSFNYKNGELHGISKYFDAKGNLIAEGLYKNGKKDGIWKYYEDGNLLKEEDFTYKPDYIKVDGKYQKAPQ